MATVTFTEARLGLASDLSDEIVFPVVTSSEVASTDGGVRQYATRRRVVTTASGAVTVSVDAVFMPRADAESLSARRGVLQVYRDHAGRVLYGTYFAAPVTERLGNHLTPDVQLSFEATTDTAEV
jgi:hypothetical protein